jgi:hypothetical protein
MSRNSSGNYTLPSGNPVVGGTTISSTWANSTLGDLESAMTDSLSRSGKGGMQAPLKVSDGTVAAPGVTWDADPDCGLYRVGANSVGMSANSSQIQRWEATGTTITGTVAVSGAATLSAGATVTGSGAGAGVTTTGGATSGHGLVATGGATNGDGVRATGTGSGTGLLAVGGTTSGVGVSGTGGAPNGYGISGLGAGNGVGVEGQGGASGGGGLFRPGTAATATTRRTAITANNGDISFTGVVAPNSNVAHTNALTAMNTPKAWALLTISSAGGVAITTGFNVTSVSVSTTTVTLTFAAAFSSANYAVCVTSGASAPYAYYTGTTTTTTVQIKARNLASGALPLSELDFSAASGSDRTFHLVVFGAQ